MEYLGFFLEWGSHVWKLTGFVDTQLCPLPTGTREAWDDVSRTEPVTQFGSTFLTPWSLSLLSCKTGPIPLAQVVRWGDFSPRAFFLELTWLLDLLALWYPTPNPTHLPAYPAPPHPCKGGCLVLSHSKGQIALARKQRQELLCINKPFAKKPCRKV